MVREAEPIDISTMPDLARLAQEVARTGKPRLLRDHDQDVAVLSPARPKRRRKALTQAERLAALEASFGGWKGLVDPDELKSQLRELQFDDREPRTW